MDPPHPVFSRHSLNKEKILQNCVSFDMNQIKKAVALIYQSPGQRSRQASTLSGHGSRKAPFLNVISLNEISIVLEIQTADPRILKSVS